MQLLLPSDVPSPAAVLRGVLLQHLEALYLPTCAVGFDLWLALQIVYYDGQFDDARLNVSLACTAALAGAAILNYAEVTDLLKVHLSVAIQLYFFHMTSAPCESLHINT